MPAGNITLLPHTLEHVRALREGADAYERRFGLAVAAGVQDFVSGPEVSQTFLERLEGATANDEWKDGFGIVHRAENTLIGLCSFTGPPVDGTVEISYGIAPSYRGRGLATEAAQMLVQRALASGHVRA